MQKVKDEQFASNVDEWKAHRHSGAYETCAENFYFFLHVNFYFQRRLQYFPHYLSPPPRLSLFGDRHTKVKRSLTVIHEKKFKKNAAIFIILGLRKISAPAEKHCPRLFHYYPVR